MDSTTVEKLQKVSAGAIEQINSWVASGVDFVAAQTPLVIQEIVTLGLVFHIMMAVVCAIIFIVALFSLKAVKKWYKELEPAGQYASMHNSRFDKLSEGQGLCVIFWHVVNASTFILTSIFFLKNIYWICHIYFCPRLYIIKEVANIIRLSSGNK